MIYILAAVVAMAARIHPILVTMAGSVAVNCITILYQNGTGKKSISALLSVGAVMLALLVFVFWIGGKMHIGGLNEIDMKSDLSLYYSFNIHDYHRATGSGDGYGGCQGIPPGLCLHRDQRHRLYSCDSGLCRDHRQDPEGAVRSDVDGLDLRIFLK